MRLTNLVFIIASIILVAFAFAALKSSKEGISFGVQDVQFIAVLATFVVIAIAITAVIIVFEHARKPELKTTFKSIDIRKQTAKRKTAKKAVKKTAKKKSKKKAVKKKK